MLSFRMSGWRVLCFLAVGWGTACVLQGQVAAPGTSPPIPAPQTAGPVVEAKRPGEVYQEAMKPLDMVRSSLDNWSDAELGALSTGIHMAREACGQAGIEGNADDDLYDLIRLCALGQDWNKTNAAALKYIAGGAEIHRAQAYAMSVDALVRMNDVAGAVKTAREMLQGLPYDAEVAYALRYLKTYLEQASDPAALTLATEEHGALVEALKAGVPLKAVYGGAVIGIGPLFDSGMRLAFLERYSGDDRGAERTCAALDGAVGAAAAMTAVDRQLIAAVRTQYGLLGTHLPEIDAERFLTTPARAVKVHSDAGFVTVLAIFPDWCPQCTKTMQGLTEFAAEHVAAKVHGYGLMVRQDDKTEARPQDSLKELKETATVMVTAEAAQVFGAVDYPLIVVTDEKGLIYFAGLIPQNAFVPNGYMEQVIGRIVGKVASVRNPAAGKAKTIVKKPA